MSVVPLCAVSMLMVGCAYGPVHPLEMSGSSSEEAGPLRISSISVYQAVQVDLMRDGQEMTNLNLPILKGRPALIRVLVDTKTQSPAHEVIADLEIAGVKKTKGLTLAGPSIEDDLGTTFNFELTADEMNVDRFEYAVSVHDEAGEAARWPADGTSTAAPKDPGPLEIVYVPFNYRVGGANLLPDTSDEALRALDAALLAVFPVARIDSKLHTPLDYEGPPLLPDGGGWNQALQALLSLRRQDRAATNVYYYGLVAPAPSFDEFCNGACVGGFAAFPPSPTSSDDFGSLGLSYQVSVSEDLDNVSVRVARQELAHNFGRPHVSCATPAGGARASGADGNYPHANGSIGVWGYDTLGKKLLDPLRYSDIQSYCNPAWISDYTYGAIFDWVARVNAASYR